MLRKISLYLFLAGFFQMGLFAQQSPIIQQGYEHIGDSSIFHYHALWFKEIPLERVVLTGSFRGWSQDMDDPQWQLRSQDGLHWKLAVWNPNFERIPARAEFKFRIDDGKWISIPAGAPNERGGNMVFMHNMKESILKAEIKNNGLIWVQTEHIPRSLNPADWLLTTAKEEVIPLAEVLPNTENSCLLVPEQPIDKRRVYYLKVNTFSQRVLCSFDGWFRELYSNKRLGANVIDGKTHFAIFSPRAELVKLYLYKKAAGDEAYSTLEMTVDEMGVWETMVPEDLKGTYYDFTVHGSDDPGNYFYEQKPIHISDPYARVNMDAWGRSRVWYATQPATPLKNGRPALEDVISYEVHVQDFTDLLPVDESIKGTLPAMHQSGLKNEQGEAIGFDYLVNLGINTLHLMPVQEFMHYPEDLWQASYSDNPLFKEMGIAEENYQWGYRTSHAFAIESHFRQKGTEPGAERAQFRDLVQAFHDRDIAVIIDIVPNHTAEDMDHEPHFFHFNVLDQQYYYRTRDLEHIGEYGNEVKTENRPMVQRWLIDQCKHFIEEFGIDGFRIDLAGQIDRQTLQKLREALGPDIIIYGEPWIGSNDPEYENNPSWDWYKHNSPITFFQDESRNAFKGSPFDLEDKDLHRGYAGGNYREFDKVKMALSAGFGEDVLPTSGINYLDIHDNWALADRFATEDWDGRKGVDENRFMIAGLLLYTSLGPIVTHGGIEIMRSKGLAPLEESKHKGEDWLEVHIKSRDDTYNLRTPNQFQWHQVGTNKGMQDIHCNYGPMYAYWQGLNRFRLSDYGKVFRQAKAVPDGYYQWIDTVNPYQLAYIVDQQVLVLINVGGEKHDWDAVDLPRGNWRLIGNISGLDHEKGPPDQSTEVILSGGQKHAFSLEGPSFEVYVKE